MLDPLGDQHLSLAAETAAVLIFRRRQPDHRADARFAALVGEQRTNQSLAREMTIQIRPTAGRDLDADSAKAVELARAMPGIASVRAYTKAQSDELLQPWLGSGLDLSPA